MGNFLELFAFLENNKIEYVIMNYLVETELDDFCYVLLKENSFDGDISLLKSKYKLKTKNEQYLYGLKPVYYCELDKTIVFFSRPSVRSLDNYQWCPLNPNVEKHFWQNSVKKNGFCSISDEDTFFYCICIIIFNRKEVLNNYTLFLCKNKNRIKLDEEIIHMFETTFYAFAKELFALIASSNFERMHDKYITFMGY